MNPEIEMQYQKNKAEFLADMVVEVNDHQEDISCVTCGDVDLYVIHKITMDREPRTEWTYSGGDDREEVVGIDYEATVKVEFVTVSLSTGVVLPVTLPDNILSRIIECIAKQAEIEAEETDCQNAEQEFEDHMYDRAMDREHNCRDMDF
ncbi:MAG TPA: hypothetical protein VI423_09840 [Paenisporosarcina sp.]|nr:hypothetical protein [Paenisporosarcina sp.]